jgi:hypothetical protein
MRSTATALTGLDRERPFYPTVLMVIASYYVLFAVMAAPSCAPGSEIIARSAFLLIAVIGYKNLWLVAVGLVGHGIFDIVHHSIIKNPGVPRWWPGFYLVFDLILGGLLAVRLMKSSLATRWEKRRPCATPFAQIAD